MTKTGTYSWIVMAGALAAIVIAGNPRQPAYAAPQRDQSAIDVRTGLAEDSYQKLKELPVMISAIRDGQIVKQREVSFNSSARFPLPPGLYDIRLEGDGMQTLVKRGIHVNEGETTNVIGGPMRVGTGVKVIEYAVGGLSREEIAARLGKLETALADLQKARQPK